MVSSSARLTLIKASHPKMLHSKCYHREVPMIIPPFWGRKFAGAHTENQRAGSGASLPKWVLKKVAHERRSLFQLLPLAQLVHHQHVLCNLRSSFSMHCIKLRYLHTYLLFLYGYKDVAIESNRCSPSPTPSNGWVSWDF